MSMCRQRVLENTNFAYIVGKALRFLKNYCMIKHNMDLKKIKNILYQSEDAKQQISQLPVSQFDLFYPVSHLLRLGFY